MDEGSRRGSAKASAKPYTTAFGPFPLIRPQTPPCHGRAWDADSNGPDRTEVGYPFPALDGAGVDSMDSIKAGRIQLRTWKCHPVVTR